MPRYVHGFFMVFFFLFPFVLCLSSNQTSTMITISNLLNNTASPWNINSHPDPCSWKGVNCSSDATSVIGLSLSGFGVSSSEFLSETCKIESLQYLDLSNNRLSSIPVEFFNLCGQIGGLNKLNFSRNRLNGGLFDFSGFVGLENLDFSFNNLSGFIPVNLGNSTVLAELRLSANFFQGEIPQQIMTYQNLSVIDLSSNKLQGTIPLSIGNLAKLEFLILSANNLIGEIPPAIGSLTKLIRFAANQNQFVGRIPSGITSYLAYLDLSYNNLTGPIPSDLLSQPNLQLVDLSYNQFVGSIPENISQNLVRLRLGSNLFNGSVPSFPSSQKLIYLEMDNNSLSGVIPAKLGSSCYNLALLNLAQNELNGTLPEELGNISKLEVLKLQFNRFTGEIPFSIFQLHKLSILNVSWNGLNGSIPPSISNLQSLAHLNLQANKLSGAIPDSIRSMNSLLELQLGQNQLGGRIPSMPDELQIALNLSSNLFQGKIPNTLSHLTALEILDLSNNSFSGEIPDFLTQLNSLTQLILSNNNLFGIMPRFHPWVAISTSGNTGLTNFTENSGPQFASKKKSVDVAAILGVLAAVFAAGVIVTGLVLFSRRFPKVTDLQSQSGEDVPPPQVIQGNLLTANVIHRSNIDFSKAMEAVAYPWNIALKTRFSTYYKATMPSGANYFVKKINWSDKIFQLGSDVKFNQELERLGKLSNSNVMIPLAYVLTVDSAYLFYEHAQRGTLFDVLHGKLGHALDWASRYSIAIGVAQGLTFLHGYSSGPILLLDLSSKSIFLKSVKEPLVGDIELYKIIDPSKSTGSLSTVAGSVGYIPPEYAYTMRVTMAGNVYSFGVILLELLTGKPAVSEGTELAKWVLGNSAQQDICDCILDLNLSRTSVAVRGQMLAILKTAISCVSVLPEARPKMKSVLRMILNAR